MVVQPAHVDTVYTLHPVSAATRSSVARRARFPSRTWYFVIEVKLPFGDRNALSGQRQPTIALGGVHALRVMLRVAQVCLDRP